MNYSGQKNNYLLLAAVILVFYPAKGLLNLSYYFFQLESYPVLFNKFIFVLVITTLSIIFLFRKFDINKYGVHILITFIAMVLSIVSKDIILIRNVSILFFLPILLSVFDSLSENNVNRIIRTFFKFTLIYMLIEYILLQININGANLISKETYQLYYSIITPDGITIDDRHYGSSWIVRSGGYMADPLAMPVLVLMSTIYFYINYRIYNSYLLYTIIGIFLVFTCISTTAIISLLFVVLLFEFRNFKIKSILTISLIFIIIIFLHPSSDYIFNRVIQNISNPKYLGVFLDYNFMLVPETYTNIIFGSWKWYENNTISSHLDIVLIVDSMGLFGIYIIYRIFLRNYFKISRKNNIYTVYTYILLSTLVTLYHQNMTLNLNVMLVVVFISNRLNNYISMQVKSDTFLCLKDIKNIVASISQK